MYACVFMHINAYISASKIAHVCVCDYLEAYGCVQIYVHVVYAFI